MQRQDVAVTVRPARRDEVPAIVALLADDPLGRERETAGDPLPDAYWRAFDEMAAQTGNLLFVAERPAERPREVIDAAPGDIIGCLQLTIIPGLSRRGTTRAQIEAVRVSAGARGSGVGEQMVRHAIEVARAAKCGLVQLTSDVSRTDAHRFYERLGFIASHVGFKFALD
jgi:ribosomal protein S18 acetylase RimI-like enzyme